MSSHKSIILHRLNYLFNILNNNNVTIDNLPHKLYKLKFKKLIYLEKQLLYIIDQRKIDINNINTKKIYNKGNEKINILTELRHYLNMISDKTNQIYTDTDKLIKDIESVKTLDKNDIDKKIEVIINL